MHHFQKTIAISMIYILLSTTCLIAKIKIMCIGDSITRASVCAQYFPYRYLLWKMLKSTTLENEIDFVGSKDTLFGVGSLCSQGYVSTPGWLDDEHEGHTGWSSYDILYGNLSDSSEGPQGKLDDWLTKLQRLNQFPDIVLIHLGTNDLQGTIGNTDLNFHQNTIDNVLNNLREIIYRIRGKNPNVRVILSKIIPICGNDRLSQFGYPLSATNQQQLNADVLNLNSRIPLLATSLNTSNSPVIVVDQATGFNINKDADSWDGVHPNMSGSQKIASRFYEGIALLYPYIVPVQVDPDYYIFANDDISYYYNHGTWPANLTQLVEHYYMFGSTEQRNASPVFNVFQYYFLNPGVQQSPGWNGKLLSEQYVTTGIHEYKKASFAFDPIYYRNKYSDIRNSPIFSTPAGVARHWALHGIGEGRVGSPVFDVTYYLNHNPDVATLVGYTSNMPYGSALISARKKALIHYNQHGIFEGRQGSGELNVANYYQRYTTLQQQFSNLSVEERNFHLVSHYLTYGISHGWDGK